MLGHQGLFSFPNTKCFVSMGNGPDGINDRRVGIRCHTSRMLLLARDLRKILGPTRRCQTEVSDWRREHGTHLYSVIVRHRGTTDSLPSSLPIRG